MGDDFGEMIVPIIIGVGIGFATGGMGAVGGIGGQGATWGNAIAGTAKAAKGL